ncbi:MAG: hypothetical protein RJA22_1529 [Verrucomicrobiota bacterium]|jgi:hypothetical protein
MSFQEPLALVFALALPVVVLFYLLKRRRSARLVSSTVLWQRFLAESQANAPFQKLRRNGLLLLQLLLLALVVLALARPFFTGNTRASRLRIVILDASASMQATDVKPKRFEVARAEALRWVEGLRDGEQMMILLAGATTEVRQSPTTDKGALRRALAGCAPTDAATRLADALKTAGAFTFEKKGEETVSSGEIHLFSDGAAPDLAEVANRNLPLVYHRVGAGANNAGIVRLDVRPNPEVPGERAVFASIGNFAAEPRSLEVELLLDGRRVQGRPLDLAPTNTQLVLFSVPQAADGVFTVRLAGAAADDLAADDQASVVSLLPQPARVLLVTKGNRFLEKALRAAPGVRLTVTPQLAQPDPPADIVVLDDVVPAAWPQANLLALHVARTNWFPAWETVRAPAIVDWATTHPLLRFVSFDNVQVAESLGVRTPPWGVPLVESPAHPLLLAGELQRQRIVWVGFDPLQSTWPLRLSFPIFIANAVDWLHPASTRAADRLVSPGAAFRLPLGQRVPQARLTLPDGRTRLLPVPADARELVVGDTMRQGVYRVEAGTNQATFCVNLLDAQESNIQPRPELALGTYERVAATRLRRGSVEIWRWMALAALAVLGLEWWWYHRRTA